MKCLYNKKFLKDLAKIPKNERISIEEFVFEEFPQSDSLSSTNRVKKLKGSKNCFKARFGDYRVGIRLNNDEVIFERVLHRKEIYRFFP